MKTMKRPEFLEEEYTSLQPILNKCLAELKRVIATQIKKIENPELVRIRLTEARVKSLASLWRKAQKNEWKPHDIFKEVYDIIGVRIVCANIEDIYRLRELLLSNPRIKEIPNSEEDRIKNPTESGYRDYKFYVLYETGDSQHPSIKCEIQIRTTLQDSWATLTHKDIYKEGDSLPKSLKKLSYRLSELLCVADQIAQDIRNEISSKKEPLKHGDKKINEDSLGLLYKKTFKVLPPDYLTRLVRNKCEELGIINIRRLEEALSSKHRRRLRNAYAKATGWNIYDDLIFGVSPLIATCGIKIAVDAVTKHGTREWEDADRIYKNEIMSELPETFQGFLDYLEPHTKDDLCDFPDRIYRVAEIFDATKGCFICGAPIVDEELFSQNAQEHYGVEDMEGQIESIVLHSGVDVGDGSLCSYHADHSDDD